MVSRRVCTVCTPGTLAFPIQKCFCDSITSPCSVALEAKRFDALLVDLSLVAS